MDLEPLYHLRLRTPRLELRLPREDELPAFARIAERGIHPREVMPFTVAWTDAVGTPGFAEGFAAFHLDARATWTPESWRLELGVWRGRDPIGFQGLAVETPPYAEHRRIVTGSWLGRTRQGHGYGTEMRAAALELAFGRLGGRTAVSAYAEGNDASRRVSEKLGYSVVGEEWLSPRGTPLRHVRVELPVESWAGELPVEIEGLHDCLPLFGVEQPRRSV